MSVLSLIERVDSFLRGCPSPDSFTKTISVIEDALRLYGPSHLALSFSGGKEACVILYLLRYCMIKGNIIEELSTKLRIIYFHDPNAFPEINVFMRLLEEDLNISYTVFSCSYKEGMRIAVEEHGITGVLMGVRVGDPHATTVEHFQPSSPSWPAFMRINPVTHWSYSEVWTFLRGCQLPYCSLYEQGYTSLGNRLNTVRNSRLAIKVEGSDELRYLPAYMLEEDDSHLERTNRTRNRCNTDEAVKPSACNAEPMLPERIVDNSAQPCVVGEMKAGSDANVARAIVICSTMPGACRVLTALSTIFERKSFCCEYVVHLWDACELSINMKRLEQHLSASMTGGACSRDEGRLLVIYGGCVSSASNNIVESTTPILTELMSNSSAKSSKDDSLSMPEDSSSSSWEFFSNRKILLISSKTHLRLSEEFDAAVDDDQLGHRLLEFSSISTRE